MGNVVSDTILELGLCTLIDIKKVFFLSAEILDVVNLLVTEVLPEHESQDVVLELACPDVFPQFV